jgi:DNA polymerase V
MHGELWVLGLVDVRSMFVSCERVINPRLERRPVVVLSNNDGCAVARSDEAKQLGIEMGRPWFEILQNPAWRDRITARSSNYELYGDFSARLVATLQELVADLEVYSVDECFVRLPAARSSEIAADIVARVRQWTGLPVTVGIGTTKSLAKVAQRTAKTVPGSVVDMTAWKPEQVQDLLAATSIGEVWGVGRRLARRLIDLGIRTALDLARADPVAIRRRTSVVLERTVRELAGQACIPLGGEPPSRRQVMHSRMLGTVVTDREAMREVLTAYTARAAARLRSHGLVASALTVTMSTSQVWLRQPLNRWT